MGKIATSLNTNSLNATSTALAITTETLVTLYVVSKTGASINHCVIVQVSPDNGTTWLDIPKPLTGVGILTHKVAATKVRAKVIKAEGGTSTVDVHLVAI